MQPYIDVISLSTTLINMISKGDAPKKSYLGTATGFFYRYYGSLFLITNRHVVIKEEKGFYPDTLIILVHNDPESIYTSRTIEIPLYKEKSPLWLEHPDYKEDVDVIAINIDDYVEDLDIINTFSTRHLIPTTRRVDLGETTLIVGYPVGFFDSFHNLPIVKSGTISSTFGVPFLDKPHFLIDANLQQGTSGSPVLIKRTVLTEMDRTNPELSLPFRLIGIYSGEYVPEGIYAGLNIVWYANLIEEILNS